MQDDILKVLMAFKVFETGVSFQLMLMLQIGAGGADAVTSRGRADGREEERCENRGSPEEHDKKKLRNDCARKHGKT